MNQKELDKQIRYLRNEFSEKFDQLQKDQKLIWKAILKMAENVDTQKEVFAETLKLTNDVQKGSVDLFREMMDEIESLKHNKIPKKYYFRLRNQKGRDIVLATIIDKGKHLFDNTIEEFVLAFSGEKILVPPTKLKWLKTDVLAVYFIDRLCQEEWLEDYNIDKKILDVFGIKQAGQKRNNYYQINKNQRPTNHVIVDDLIAIIRENLKEILK